MSELSGEKYLYNGNIYSTSDDVYYVAYSNKDLSVYEVIRVEDGTPLFLDDYLQRLQNSFQSFPNPVNYSLEEIKNSIYRLIKLHPGKSGPLKMVFGLQKPGHFLMFFMKPHLPSEEEYQTGVKTVLLNEERDNPNIKAWNEDLRNKSIFLLKSTGAYEAILVNAEGFITEASRSNVFFIKENKIFTTPVSLVLPGITRKKVIEVCKQTNVDVVFENIAVKDLGKFNSCFLTGTARKIVPVRNIDDILFDPQNSLLRQTSFEFEKLVQKYIDGSVS